jgi:hypothetical protein
MPQPIPYDRQFNFQDHQAVNPVAPPPGEQLDMELNAAKITLDQILAGLAKLLRDDGALKNGIVTKDSLAPSLSIGFTFTGTWTTPVNYVAGDGVFYGTSFYRAKVSHLSSNANRPDVSTATWMLLADFTAAAALAQGYAEAAAASAASLDGTAISTSFANRVRVDTAAQGLNTTQQGNARTNIGLGNSENPVIYPTGTSGSLSIIGRQFGTTSGAINLRNINGIWTNQLVIEYGWQKSFGAGVSSANGPATTHFVMAINTGSAADVCAAVDLAYAEASNVTVFGRNIIAGAGNYTNVKIATCEFDWEPSAGTTINNASLGIANNAFSKECPVGFLWGGVGGGTFLNGMVFSHVTAACIAGSGSLGYLINSGPASYTGECILLNAGHKISFGSGKLYGNADNTTRFLMGANHWYVRDSTDTDSFLAVYNTGKVGVGKYAGIIPYPALSVAYPSTTESDCIGSFSDSSGVPALQVFVSRSGATLNPAASTLRVHSNSVTSRSITASGAAYYSGADYAEYERKGPTCGGVVKGQIVGFDRDGLLTDQFDAAISFAVKSTNPNTVGGDTWADDLGAEPVEPIFSPREYTGPNHPGDCVIPDPGDAPTEAVPKHGRVFATRVARAAREKAKRQARKESFDAYHAQLDAWAAAWLPYEAEEIERREAFEAGPMAEYRAAKGAFDAALEVERQKVDRIAYCGKVPVNVTGAASGDWIVPVRSDEGAIAAAIVADADLTFPQMKRAVGRVRRILDDGRAEIVVK